MTVTVVSTNTSVNGNVWDAVANGDGFWLMANVSAGSKNTFAISCASYLSDISIAIDGGLFAAGTAVLSGAARTNLTVGEAGSVTSLNGPNNFCISLSGGGSTVVNYGTITAAQTMAVSLTFGSNTLVNEGSVYGRTGAVLLGINGSSDVLVNKGVLTSGGTPATLSPNRFGHTVQTEGNDTIITNSGIISTSGVGTGTAIHIGDGSGGNAGTGTQVTNLADGEIVSARGIGISALGMVGGSMSIDNAGLIQGGLSSSSFDGGSGNFILLANSGIMRGTVYLADAFASNVRNSGTIDGDMVIGGSFSLSLKNTGDILGGVAIVNGTNNTITNSGLIDGNFGGSGVIDLKNTGEITGDVAVSGQVMTIVNQGTIDGDISFSTAGGSYSGARGHVYGTIRTQGDVSVIAGIDDDTILSLGGKLTANGRAGDDILGAGTGLDKLTGGAGADTFVFAGQASSTVEATGRDLITDFSRSQGDLIDLSTVIDGDLDFIGKAKFSGTDQVRYEVVGKSTFVYVNLDADTPEMAIEFKGKIAFAEGDFLL